MKQMGYLIRKVKGGFSYNRIQLTLLVFNSEQEGRFFELSHLTYGRIAIEFTGFTGFQLKSAVTVYGC